MTKTLKKRSNFKSKGGLNISKFKTVKVTKVYKKAVLEIGEWLKYRLMSKGVSIK